MKRLVVLAALAALVSAGAAPGGNGDPQKRLTAADQARAKAMLVRKADLGRGFRATPSSGADGNIDCAALDGSDLTLTGQAESPTFQGGVQFVSSQSEIYASRADSMAAWRRATSEAADACVERRFRATFAEQGAQLESFRRMSFPRTGERSVAYRLVISSGGVRAFVDVVGLKLGRAQTGLLLGSALTPLPRSVEVGLARTVAGRMARAMHGAQAP